MLVITRPTRKIHFQNVGIITTIRTARQKRRVMTMRNLYIFFFIEGKR